MPFLTLSFGWEGSPSKIDDRTSWYQLILSSLEDPLGQVSLFEIKGSRQVRGQQSARGL